MVFVNEMYFIKRHYLLSSAVQLHDVNAGSQLGTAVDLPYYFSFT